MGYRLSSAPAPALPASRPVTPSRSMAPVESSPFMVSDPYVIWLQECNADRAAMVGGKATGLGSLLREGLQVPPGFAVSTHAYRAHLAYNSLAGEIDTLLRSCQQN